MICHRTANYKLQRDVTKKNTYSRVMVLALYRTDTIVSRNSYLKSLKGRDETM